MNKFLKNIKSPLFRTGYHHTTIFTVFSQDHQLSWRLAPTPIRALVPAAPDGTLNCLSTAPFTVSTDCLLRGCLIFSFVSWLTRKRVSVLLQAYLTCGSIFLQLTPYVFSILFAFLPTVFTEYPRTRNDASHICTLDWRACRISSTNFFF